MKNRKLEVNLEDVKKFIISDKFYKFLLDNTTDLTIATYILQTLLDSLERKD